MVPQARRIVGFGISSECVVCCTTSVIFITGFLVSCREYHFDKHVKKRTILPDHLIVKSRGTDIFTQELTRVTIDHDYSQRYFDTFSSKLPLFL